MSKLSAFRKAAGISSKSLPNTPPSDQVSQETANESTPDTKETTPDTREPNSDTSEPSSVDVPSTESAPTTEEPTTSAPAPTAPAVDNAPATPEKAKRGRKVGKPKARVIVLVDSDLVEIISSFKMPHSAVVRAVISGAKGYLANIEGEITEAELTTRIRSLLG